MSTALGSFNPFYYYPLGGICPVIQPFVKVEKVSFGRCGPGVQHSSCSSCCSRDGVRMTNPSHKYRPECLVDSGLACDGTPWPPGFNTSVTPRPELGDVLYGATTRSCTVNNTIALTYDDGPSQWTPDLLDILKANDVKATFFIRTLNLYDGLSRHIYHKNPAIIRRIYDEGHQIASHTWSHRDMNKLSSQERKDEMIKAEMALNDILGFFPTYMRPPFNSCGEACESDMGDLGYHTVKCDLDGRDWEGNYTATERNFMWRIREQKNRLGLRAWLGLAHDTHQRTVHGYTQFMIDNAREHGYKLVRVGECLNDPEENWYRDPLTGGALLDLPRKDLA